MSDRNRLRAALFLIGTTCESNTSSSCIDNGRSLFASYSGEGWCHGCIAASALGLDPDCSKQDAQLSLAELILKQRGRAES